MVRKALAMYLGRLSIVNGSVKQPEHWAANVQQAHSKILCRCLV